MMSRLLVLVVTWTLASQVADVTAAPKDYPHTPVPFTQVTVEDGFWSPRLKTNREVTVRYDFTKCEETGRIANFARAGGLEEGPFEGIPFNDSDVVKVVEGASYALALQPDAELDAYLDALLEKIAAAQEEDGYLYSARTIGLNNDFTGPTRWSNLRRNHELYNVGHMYEAAVAHYQATGKRTLLDVAIRNADLVCEVFGPNPGQLIDVPGHQEIEIGLVKLYRITGDEKYLRQAQFFIDMRGRADLRAVYGDYCQDHVPVIEQKEAVGHAVRGGYFYAGVADVAAITGNQEYIAAIDRIWEDVIQKKIYLIGNVGQHGAGEGYAGPYKLDNLKAYNETCAAIGLALWNHRMFLLHGESKYIDVLERSIYNGFLAGVSLEGNTFFYPNPLSCDMKFGFNHGDLERSPWFGCSCCPVNVVRFLPSIAGYVYAHRDEAAYVNLFVAGSGTMELPSGRLTLTQQTEYPWHGDVSITVDPSEEAEFDLHIRIPGWARGEPLASDLYRYLSPQTPPVTLRVNGQEVTAPREKGYAVLRRTWKPGDTVELQLPMLPRRVLSHEKIEPNRGRVAIERGPLVYCVEGADHNGRVLDIFLTDDVALEPVHQTDLLGGVTVLKGKGATAFLADDDTIETLPIDVTLIPYHVWCHRGANEMAVWIPRSADVVDLPKSGAVGLASASHTNPSDGLDALQDRILPKSSGDHAIARHTWWPHRGSSEWVQYDLPKPKSVSSVGVYWFDDTGRGKCRVPDCWRLFYRDGQKWKPVTGAASFGTTKDRFNRVTFDPVVTDGLRIEVQLQAEFSGGILEWEVE